MARPRKVLDARQLHTLNALAAIGCTVPEMEQVIGISKRTLERHYLDEIEKGRLERNVSLRRKQYELAMRGDKTMLIWLGKQLLGQSDRQPVPKVSEVNKDTQFLEEQLRQLPDEKLDEELQLLFAKARL